ncbi:tail protein X [Fodinicurvata sp. EGI_FJ10296]|uniref:tail protein X n=1 Tax=Fodinicurvata sp. EGI_FJ10296 TaxID=3231908 RepID=UPI003454A18B
MTAPVDTATVITTEGAVLDEIVWRHYGRTEGVVERVIAANRHLESFGPILPAGVRITLPPLPPAPERRVIRIWG